MVSQNTPRTMSFLNAVGNMSNSAMGAGVVAFPFAFRCAGWGYGYALMAVVCGVMFLTLCILIRYADKTGTSNFQELVQRTVGPRFASLIGAAMFLYLWASCTAYNIVIGDSVSSVLKTAGLEGIWLHRQTGIIVVNIFVLIPLCLLQNLDSLSVPSLLVIPIMIYLAVLVTMEGLEVTHNLSENIPEAQPHHPMDIWGAISIIVFAFQCHTTVIPCFAELSIPDHLLAKEGVDQAVSGPSAPLLSNEDDSLPTFDNRPMYVLSGSSANPRGYSDSISGAMVLRMQKATGIAMLFCIVIYGVVGFFGYAAFGLDVSSDVLQSFTKETWPVSLGRILIALVATVSYPINHFPARLIIEDLFWPWVYGSPSAQPDVPNPNGSMALPFSRVRYVSETLVFMLTCMLVSLFVEDLGAVFQVVGSLLGNLFIFITPALIILKDLRPSNRTKHVSTSVLLLITAIILVLGLVLVFEFPVTNTDTLMALKIF